MSERGTPGDGPPACPFIAFEDERDERSSSPDHRHRCFAEVTPAPRALAHQEAYCLSSAFPVCPTFQDWARREAAQARAAGRTPAGTAGVAVAVVASTDVDDGDPDDVDDDVDEDDDAGSTAPTDDDGEDLWTGGLPSEDPPARRNPPRDWAAPPPWASGGPAGSGAAGAGGSGGASGGSGNRPSDRPVDASAAARAAGAGLAGSAADRLASGQPGAVPASSPPSDELAGLVAPAAARAANRPPPLTRPPTGAHPTTTSSGRRPTVSSTRARTPAPDHDGPSWESARRYEAYPTIKTRARLPGIPRVLLWVAALGIAAAGLFFLPDVLDLVGGGGGAAGPTPGPSSSSIATAEPSETPIPEPTAQTYTIKKGDTLNKVAKKYGLTLDALLAANKATIKNADKIKVGQVIVIPVPVPDEFTDPSAGLPSDEPSAGDSPAP
jgi:nucleoid-associated protein YgaU